MLLSGEQEEISERAPAGALLMSLDDEFLLFDGGGGALVYAGEV